MSIEIELKFRILDIEIVKKFLESYKKISVLRVYDVYFDTPQADLLQQGIYIRLRNNTKIDIKFNRECLQNPRLEIQPYCEEYSFRLPLQGDEITRFNNLNEELGLWPAFGGDIGSYKKVNDFVGHRVVDKVRTAYEVQGMTILLDDVVGLGLFLEIELVTQDQSIISSTAARMKEFLAKLPLEVVKTGYESLILRKQNYEQYLKGRFILDEDKKALGKEYNV